MRPARTGALFRSGRLFLDAAAFLASTPLIVVYLLGAGFLMLALLIGLVLLSLGVVAWADFSASFQRLAADPQTLVLLFGLPMISLGLLSLVAWARTGALAGALALLVGVAVVPIAVATGLPLSEGRDFGGQAFWMSDMASTTAICIAIVGPLLAAVGASLMVIALVMPSAEATARRTWPAFSIPLFAARHAIGHPRFWLALVSMVLRVLLALLLFTVVVVVCLTGLIILGIVVMGALPIDHWELGQSNELMTYLTLAIAAGAVALLDTIYDLVRRRSAPVLAWLAFAAASLAFAGLASAWWDFLRSKGEIIIFDMTDLTYFTVFLTGFAFRGFLTAPILRAVGRVRSDTARSAKELSARRPEPPVLFLRSFADDEQTVRSNDAGLAFAVGAPRERVRIEELVSRVMFAKGPLVAFANPATPGTPIGAARDVAPMDDWQNQLLDYLARSQIVVCFLGRTPSFLWELDQIVRLGRVRKMILVLSPYYLKDLTLTEHAPVLAGLLGLEGEEDERTALAGARALAFSADEDCFNVFTSPRADALSYEEAILGCAALVSAAV